MCKILEKHSCPLSTSMPPMPMAVIARPDHSRRNVCRAASVLSLRCRRTQCCHSLLEADQLGCATRLLLELDGCAVPSTISSDIFSVNRCVREACRSMTSLIPTIGSVVACILPPPSADATYPNSAHACHAVSRGFGFLRSRRVSKDIALRLAISHEPPSESYRPLVDYCFESPRFPPARVPRFARECSHDNLA